VVTGLREARHLDTFAEQDGVGRSTEMEHAVISAMNDDDLQGSVNLPELVSLFNLVTRLDRNLAS
jgi:hypothetical protein